LIYELERMPPINLRSISYFLLLLLTSMGAAPALAVNAQGSTPGRKIIRQTMPVYPALARQVSLAGTVKVVAVVTPEGKVRAVEPMGGSPILIDAAKDAVSQWKFAPAAAESRETIELHFHP
jgi:TonB family protein